MQDTAVVLTVLRIMRHAVLHLFPVLIFVIVSTEYTLHFVTGKSPAR